MVGLIPELQVKSSGTWSHSAPIPASKDPPGPLDLGLSFLFIHTLQKITQQISSQKYCPVSKTAQIPLWQRQCLDLLIKTAIALHFLQPLFFSSYFYYSYFKGLLCRFPNLTELSVRLDAVSYFFFFFLKIFQSI